MLILLWTLYMCHLFPLLVKSVVDKIYKNIRLIVKYNANMCICVHTQTTYIHIHLYIHILTFILYKVNQTLYVYLWLIHTVVLLEEGVCYDKCIFLAKLY